MKDIDTDRMIRTFGNIPGDLMNFGFLLLNPARLMIDKYVGFMENMDNKDFVENFVRMERWIFDSPDVPGETFHLLIQSKMFLGGKLVDLKKLTMPLLNFFGEYDHLVPPQACNQLTKASGSKDTEDVCLETGHIGIYVSSKFQRQFAPKIAQWLKERDRKEIKQEPQVKREQQLQGSTINKKPAVKKASMKKKAARKPKITRQAPPRKSKLSLIQKISEAI
jgi:polyhydroxyalkanoate synthase